MSRIHDALKRAEHEKQGGSTGASANLLGEELHGVPNDAPSLATATSLAADHDPINATEWRALTWDDLAQIPISHWEVGQEMLFLSSLDDNCPGMEEFRTLRSRLYRIRDRRALRTILVGSALPGEGKTYVAANLAQVLARQIGKKALLIDADLRKASLHAHLGTNPVPGLSDYLRGDCEPQKIFQRGSMENLFVIPAGTEFPNPAELLGNGRLNKLIAELSPIFDWIIIDSPPVVPVSDATLIAPVCDGVLIVIRAALTPFDMAKKARHEFRQFPIVGAVLNRTDVKSKYGYYYQDGYGRRGNGYGQKKAGPK